MNKLDMEQIARRALALCGVMPQGIELDLDPVICKDDEGHLHRSANAIAWRQVINGAIVRHGFITRMGRVTEFSHEKNFTGQKVLPFGGSWESGLESEYQQYRWLAWNAAG